MSVNPVSGQSVGTRFFHFHLYLESIVVFLFVCLFFNLLDAKQDNSWEKFLNTCFNFIFERFVIAIGLFKKAKQNKKQALAHG